jgi:sRNA-binding carbon storage regulator CsrA
MIEVTQYLGDTLNLTTNDQHIKLRFLDIADDETKIAVSIPDEEAFIRRELLDDYMECCF